MRDGEPLRGAGGGGLRVVEVFESIQGEGPFTGAYSLFIRLAGCNLRCPFCDTKYSWNPSRARVMSIGELLEAVEEAEPSLVVVTGGEPLLQAMQLEGLIHRLVEAGYKVQVETNGTLPAPPRSSPLSKAYYVVSPKDVPVRVPGARTHESWLELARSGGRVWFKFLASKPEHVKEIVEYVERKGIPRGRVYVMPLTAEAMSLEELLELHKSIAREAVARRLNFSPRLHLLLGLK
jgi:7-carboxy-7-deazaguanine synthase